MDNNRIELSDATLDDIVFENRNKSYGAYLLRKLYDRHVIVALVISISVFSLLIALPVIIKFFTPEEEVIIVEEPKKEITLIDIPLEKEVKQIPIEQPPPPEIKQVKFVAFEPAPDEEVKEKINVKLDSVNISTINKDGKDTLADLPPVVDIGPAIPSDDDGVWMGAITDEASFPGGKTAFHTYIKSHMSAKAINFAQDRGIKGRVFVKFIVKKDGSVESAEIVPGKDIASCPLCNEAALEVIRKMPKWSPAKNNGNEVNRIIVQPIAF